MLKRSVNVGQIEGNFLYHTSCAACGSSDANAIYDNGTSYCFSCQRAARDVQSSPTTRPKQSHRMRELLHGEPTYLQRRGISEDICKKYGYWRGTDASGTPCQIANYYNNEGERVAQKLRYADKTFKFIGDPKQALMYGQNLFSKGGKKITITEGELDALSVAEAFKGMYPIVSIKNGAQSAKKELSQHIEWLNSFDEVYLWFDNDEVGRKAVEDCITLFPAGKVKVVQHPEFKDANEILMNKGTGEVANTFYNAREFRPDGFVCPDDLLEEALKPIEIGVPWMYPKLTELTYGRRYGEIVALGAGVAVGKTDFIMQQIAFDVGLNMKVATFMLEQSKVETLLRICGKIDGVHYHLPDSSFDKNKLTTTIHKLNSNLYIYDNFGRIDWETIKAKIRSASLTYGIKLFYIDNLTALNAHAEDERRHLDGLMEEVASLAKELNIWILLVSHLNPPKKGASHEAGGRVEQAMFTGSRAIMRWSYLMLGIERNTLAETPADRQRGLVRCIKDRFSGKATGKTISFIYDTETGMCHPTDETFDVAGKDDSGDDF